ncbi:hypothetical protein V5O48_014695 [Marasmius crinis-equi]|uniref:Uncharacterized protein n=1 Tax=Marasmius crinis-equi TaxID=585013 RepID=A0ABR3EWX7_9AGAR
MSHTTPQPGINMASPHSHPESAHLDLGDDGLEDDSLMSVVSMASNDAWGNNPYNPNHTSRYEWHKDGQQLVLFACGDLSTCDWSASGTPNCDQSLDNLPTKPWVAAQIYCCRPEAAAANVALPTFTGQQVQERKTLFKSSICDKRRTLRDFDNTLVDLETRL